MVALRQSPIIMRIKFNATAHMLVDGRRTHHRCDFWGCGAANIQPRRVAGRGERPPGIQQGHASERPAGLVALFSEDAILLTPDGPLVGHAAIEKRFEGLFKAIVSKEPSKLEKVVMISDALRLRTGSWSAVVQSPNGSMPVKGYWSTTDERDGNSWKIRMETDNVTMPQPPGEPEK